MQSVQRTKLVPETRSYADLVASIVRIFAVDPPSPMYMQACDGVSPPFEVDSDADLALLNTERHKLHVTAIGGPEGREQNPKRCKGRDQETEPPAKLPTSAAKAAVGDRSCWSPMQRLVLGSEEEESPSWDECQGRGVEEEDVEEEAKEHDTEEEPEKEENTDTDIASGRDGSAGRNSEADEATGAGGRDGHGQGELGDGDDATGAGGRDAGGRDGHADDDVTGAGGREGRDNSPGAGRDSSPEAESPAGRASRFRRLGREDSDMQSTADFSPVSGGGEAPPMWSVQVRSS